MVPRYRLHTELLFTLLHKPAIWRRFLEQQPQLFFTFLFVDFRETESKGEKERNTDLLFYLFMYSLVDSCLCPEQGSNPQPWCIGMMLQPAEHPAKILTATISELLQCAQYSAKCPFTSPNRSVSMNDYDTVFADEEPGVRD